MGLGEEGPPANRVPAVRRLGLEHRRPRGVRAPRLLEPLEPAEVHAKPPGRDAVEAREEAPQPRVQGVDHAEFVLRGLARVVPVVGRHAGGPEGHDVGAEHVRRDLGPREVDAGDRPADPLRAGLAPRRHAAEAVAEVVGAGDDADLEPRQPARARLAAVPVRLPGHEPVGVVPLEGLVKVELVHLDRRPLSAPEGPDLPRHHVAEPQPHVPGRRQAHGAPLRALPERGALERGADELEPRRQRQLRERQQPARPPGEGAAAPAADPPLGAVGVAPAPGHVRAAAPRALPGFPGRSPRDERLPDPLGELEPVVRRQRERLLQYAVVHPGLLPLGLLVEP